MNSDLNLIKLRCLWDIQLKNIQEKLKMYFWLSTEMWQDPRAINFYIKIEILHVDIISLINNEFRLSQSYCTDVIIPNYRSILNSRIRIGSIVGEASLSFSLLKFKLIICLYFFFSG